jgi:DNA primase
VNYDGDRAGVAAAKRAIETILAEDIEVKILVLPDNTDPDDFIRKNGVDEYNRRRTEAQPHIQFVIDQAVRDRNLNTPADKAAAVGETLPFIRAVRDRIQKREYFDIAMDGLRVQRDQRRELWQQVRGGASTDSAAVQRVFVKIERPTVAEEKLLGLLVANNELRKIILPRLEPSDYQGLATATIFGALKQLGSDEREVTYESLSEATAGNDGAAAMLPRILINEPAESFDESLADANSCLDALRLMKLDREIDELSTQIAEADRADDTELRDRLVMKKLELSKQRGNFLPHGKIGN